ncbi:aquaporin-like protein [Rhizodiscina lignyota]|uniref:Aquaporin-like protein n=1 Tax=Rhizodiscina lignyota TaxID=1504668 RepID=A0A9P4IJ58_9PEZI|nr:aquaporin-like protein [Rhizodiscina lignyota]
MAQTAQPHHDIEKDINDQSRGDLAAIGRFEQHPSTAYRSSVSAFAGRLGGNGTAVIDRNDPQNADILKDCPDAAPWMSLKEQFDLRPFKYPGLWKAAVMEGMGMIQFLYEVEVLIFHTIPVLRTLQLPISFIIEVNYTLGTLMVVYITIWANASPNVIPAQPTAQLGPFDNAAFIGPLVGGLINFMVLTLFTFGFGAVTGAHLNPAITIATFFARLCSLPRLVLYLASQVIGAALAGLLIRASLGSRDFKVGGCWLFTDVVPVGDAFVLEFVFCTTLLFFAFGVGLDPRQRQTVGPTLAPFLVGFSLSVLSFGSGFTRYGLGGASMNPARCFGTFVGSRFPGYHWIHWIADIAAGMVHGFFYAFCPPWEKTSP